jgi:hypothetical protein
MLDYVVDYDLLWARAFVAHVVILSSMAISCVLLASGNENLVLPSIRKRTWRHYDIDRRYERHPTHSKCKVHPILLIRLLEYERRGASQIVDRRTVMSSVPAMSFSFKLLIGFEDYEHWMDEPCYVRIPLKEYVQEVHGSKEFAKMQ